PIRAPPTVDAGRERPSLLRNAYNPSPARIGCRPTMTPTARLAGRTVNASMAGRYIHPDCGSAANGTPAMAEGLHTGMLPARSERARNDQLGSQHARRS